MSESELRAAWEKWARQTFGGDARKVSVATEAALRTVKKGGPPTEATRRAQEAVMALSKPDETLSPKFDLIAARQQWSTWALREIMGDEQDRANATEAAIQALAGGRPVEEAISAAKATVKAPPAGMVRGRVVGLKQRFDIVGRTSVPVLSFRVQRFDPEGRLLPPVLVEIQGGEFEGSLNEGDVVQFTDDRREGTGMVRLKALSNLSTGVPYGRPASVKKLVSSAPFDKASIGSTHTGRKLWRWSLLFIGLGITLQSCVRVRARGQPHNSSEAMILLIANIQPLVSWALIIVGAILMLRYMLRRRAK